MKSYALITGASRGIGRAISLQLAKEGRPLILLCSKDEEGLRKTAAEAGALLPACDGLPNVLTYLCDVSVSAQVDRLFDDLAAKGIGHPADHPADISLLINNAAVSHFELVQDMTDETWNRIIGVNLNGVFYTCRRVVPMMLHKKAGAILNISSYWGIHGSSMESAYCASKGAVNAFTLSLAQELELSGITVNALAPEFVDTAMNAHLTEEEKNEAISQMPSARLYTSDDIAEMALQILHADPPVTGKILLAEDLARTFDTNAPDLKGGR